MRRLAAIDSMLLVWGIKRTASAGQEGMVSRTLNLFDALEREKYSLLIPSPVLAEVLAPIPLEDRIKVSGLIGRNMRIYPFDTFCAEIYADMFYKYKTDVNNEELRQFASEHRVPKVKMKFDYMISAIAVANKAEFIYSDDSGLRKFASPFIEVRSVPNLIVPTPVNENQGQQSLFS